MLIGRFGNTSDSPFIEASIFIPRFNLRGLVSFLIDTGADGTVLMPPDARKLGIPFGNLRNETISEGIGGQAKGFIEDAVVVVSDRKHIYAYHVGLEISAPTRTNSRFNSILGRDIMRYWRLVVDYQAGKCLATP